MLFFIRLPEFKIFEKLSEGIESRGVDKEKDKKQKQKKDSEKQSKKTALFTQEQIQEIEKDVVKIKSLKIPQNCKRDRLKKKNCIQFICLFPFIQSLQLDHHYQATLETRSLA